MASQTAKQMVFSFLTSGPSYRCEVPGDFPELPELSSPIVSGVGARSFVFTPGTWAEELTEGMARDGHLLRTLIDRDGRPVQLYLRSDPPVVWWLRWAVDAGVIVTHLREADGVDQADVVVASLSIVEGGPTPFLLLHAPLRRAVHSFPGYQESASVWGPEGEIAVQLIRPAFLPQGKVVRSSWGGVTHLRVGTADAIEIQVSAGTVKEADDALALVLDTLGALD